MTAGGLSGRLVSPLESKRHVKILTEPEHGGGGRGGLIGLLLVALALLALGAGAWLLLRRSREAPQAPPPLPRARTSPAPRPSPTASAALDARDRAGRSGGPVAGAALPRLRVDADVPGANVFLDRKFLGTTPVETRDFEPGPHRLNVSAEGYEMYGETIELSNGSNERVIRFKEVRLDERVDVVHKHGVGSCKGRLHATSAGLRFEADKAGDSFTAPFASLEPLLVDYLQKNLRVKLKGGKTYNFTSDSADALLVFQKTVEAARARL
jgi:hypothetical protein